MTEIETPIEETPDEGIQYPQHRDSVRVNSFTPKGRGIEKGQISATFTRETIDLDDVGEEVVIDAVFFTDEFSISIEDGQIVQESYEVNQARFIEAAARDLNRKIAIKSIKAQAQAIADAALLAFTESQGGE